jgi:hypothetical protein
MDELTDALILLEPHFGTNILALRVSKSAARAPKFAIGAGGKRTIVHDVPGYAEKAALLARPPVVT